MARGHHQVPVPVGTWLEEIESHPLVEVLPITARIAAESVRLGRDFPKDPADQRIRRWGKVPVI